MRKIFFLAFALVAMISYAGVYVEEDAFTAVRNMGPGWNLGNTLDAYSGTPNDGTYETSWGQPKVTQDLIHMFKEAGFGTIRVPVTWYPYMDGSNRDAWMARVKEVVKYVLDEGMYCILNTHHDSGTHDGRWQMAQLDDKKDAVNLSKFTTLWSQIANEFNEFDHHLLFEGYNEILDGNNWENPTDDNLIAINSYAEAFVNTVRSTKGNNATRNLILNTYAAKDNEKCINGLVNPEKDNPSRHIIFEVHSYPNMHDHAYLERLNNTFNYIKSRSQDQNVPFIIGEWGCWEQTQAVDNNGTTIEKLDGESNTVDIPSFREMAIYLTSRCKAEGVGAVLWMLLCEEKDRTVPQWTTNFHGKDYSKVKDAIISAWYSTDCKVKFAVSNSSKLVGNDPDASNQWTRDAEFGISGGTVSSEGLTGTSTITAPKGYKISGVTATSVANVNIDSQSVPSGDTYVPQPPATSINISSEYQITDLRFTLVSDDTYEESHHNDFCTVVGTRDANTPVNFIAYENDAWYANEIKLCDAADYTSDVAVNADKFSFSRNYVDTDAATNGYWQPLCLPVSVPYESWSMFASEILDFTGVDVSGNVTLQFAPVVGALEANHPYIFKPATSSMNFVITPASTVEVSKATSVGSVTKDNYKLTGTYSTIPNLDQAAYALWNGEFHHPNGANIELKPFRVYLTVDNGSSVPERIAIKVVDPEQTGLENVLEDLPATDDAYYDLMGRRVENPSSGLYIHRSKKVYLR